MIDHGLMRVKSEAMEHGRMNLARVDWIGGESADAIGGADHLSDLDASADPQKGPPIQ
jgi:hypothetical protein